MVKIVEEIEVVKEFTFDAAHCLPEHPGACKNLHGHTYRLQVGFQGPINPKTGVVIDFIDVKQVVKGIIVDKLDHSFLNNLRYAGFPYRQPTAEKMVEWMVYVIHATHLPDSNAKLSFVRLWETPTSYAEWKRG